MDEFGRFSIVLRLVFKNTENQRRERTIVFFREYVAKSRIEDVKKAFLLNNSTWIDPVMLNQIQFVFQSEAQAI